MERQWLNFFTSEMLSRMELVRLVEVLPTMKHTALVVEMRNGMGSSECLYRPEKGVSLTLDVRIPKPQELYRDVAYHRVDQVIGWGVSVPVVPLTLEGIGKGVLRPYYMDVKRMEVYHFTRDRLMRDADFWIRAAVLDYVCGVVDRTANDVLVIDGNPWLVDSGLSFVDGLEFVCHHSQIRDTLRGIQIGDTISSELAELKNESLSPRLTKLIRADSMAWLIKRTSRILEAQTVL